MGFLFRALTGSVFAFALRGMGLTFSTSPLGFLFGMIVLAIFLEIAIYHWKQER